MFTAVGQNLLLLLQDCLQCLWELSHRDHFFNYSSQICFQRISENVYVQLCAALFTEEHRLNNTRRCKLTKAAALKRPNAQTGRTFLLSPFTAHSLDAFLSWWDAFLVDCCYFAECWDGLSAGCCRRPPLTFASPCLFVLKPFCRIQFFHTLTLACSFLFPLHPRAIVLCCTE